jgi:TolB-like protein
MSRWVADEAELALRSEKLVPIRFDDIESPIGFRQIQTIDFVGWSGRADHTAMQSLIRAVTERQGGQAPSTSSPPKVQPEDPLDIGTVAPERPSIAILPFKSLGADPDQEFLADGIRFGISATLVQLSGLFLVHATTLNAYRETEVSAVSVGTDLGVQYVLEGAVQQSGKNLRATIQLTEVKTNHTLWAERYERVVEDVFNLQVDIMDQELFDSLVPFTHAVADYSRWKAFTPPRR